MAVGLVITILLLSHQISSSIQQSDQLDQFTSPKDRDENLPRDRRTLKNQTESKLVEARAKICGLETEIQCEQKERSDEFIKINSKISQSDDRSTKIDADLKEIDSKVDEMSRNISTIVGQIQTDLMEKIAKLEAALVDGRERNRELERKIAETKMKNDDLEAQLRTQNTEVREGKAKIGELDGKINALQNKNSGLETQIQFERENKTAEIVKLRADLNRTMSFLDLDGWSYLAKTASWYKVMGQDMTFDQAEAYCASQKIHLVSIHSQEENDFVWELAKTLAERGFWIGMKRNPNKGNALEWTDGSSVDFTNWYPRYPDSNTHAYLQSYHGKWAVWSPANQRPFICKRSSQF
ncbi:unnamed protein product, partial [Mesorhabditis belari]|uniref:C-type lectin domain-containing protein n=1 Tax=Mesorhabditis belari TaxID=2138241 RepID=A0AAF3EQA9_9BILA